MTDMFILINRLRPLLAIAGEAAKLSVLRVICSEDLADGCVRALVRYLMRPCVGVCRSVVAVRLYPM